MTAAKPDLTYYSSTSEWVDALFAGYAGKAPSWASRAFYRELERRKAAIDEENARAQRPSRPRTPRGGKA